MKSRLFYIVVVCPLFVFSANTIAQEAKPAYALAIHGGAGRIPSDPQHVEKREKALRAAAELGEAMLKDGASSLDVVEAVIHVLEDAPEFNAGRGAVLNAAGAHELDASIMDGRDRSCGAVAGVSTVRHPITLARAVMTDTRHVLLSSGGAEAFADSLGAERILRVPNKWFSTKRQRENLKKAQALRALNRETRIGTVGCVVLDRAGHLAAGTSTGGMTNKKFGRVGDSPIVGAGTFADDETCAVSCTGVGEDFIRNAIAYDIAARMKYAAADLSDAVDAVLKDKKHPIQGGIIAVSSKGKLVARFNSSGMSRATVSSTDPLQVFVK